MTSSPRSGLRGLSPALIPLALVFLAVGISAAVSFPFLSLFLSTDVRATPGLITVFLVASPLAGVLVSSLVGRLSDRYPIRRKILVGAALTGLAGAAVTAFARDFWVLFALSVTATALAGSLYPQTFAYARQILERDSPGRAAMGITAMRTVFSAAWVGGPPLAALLLDTGGFPLVYAMAAALYALAAVVAAFWLDDVEPTADLAAVAPIDGVEPAPVTPARRDGVGPPSVAAAPRAAASRGVLLATVVAFILLQVPLPLSVQALPLFIHADLHRDASRAGVILGLCAALEIPLMLGLGALTTRYRLRPLLLGGAAFGIAYYGIGALAPNLWTLAAAQVLNALFISAVTGLGISYVQDLLPGEPGRATTLFTNTLPIGAAVSGPLLGLSAHFDYRLAYAMSTALCAAGLLLLLATPARPRPAAGGDLDDQVEREAVGQLR